MTFMQLKISTAATKEELLLLLQVNPLLVVSVKVTVLIRMLGMKAVKLLRMLVSVD